jgi:(p)ppGpp synthase/HD superfamily hydrolase
VTGGGRDLRDLLGRLPLAHAALAYAERQHAGQRRQVDGAPFILHPIEVATLLHRAGAADHVIAAGLLHDTLEKTDSATEDLRERFGPAVATVVTAVSEDDRLRGYHKRKAALRQQVADAGRDALTVFAADKISKVRELKIDPARQSDPAGARRKRRRRLVHYGHCLDLLDARLPDSPLVDQLRAELKSVADAPAHQPTGAGAA